MVFLKGKKVEKEERVEGDDMFVYGFSTSMTVPVENEVGNTTESTGRESEREVLHEAIKVLRLLQKCLLSGFV